MTTAALLGVDSCPMEGFDLDKVTEILSEEEFLILNILVFQSWLVLAIELKSPRTVKSVKVKVMSLVG